MNIFLKGLRLHWRVRWTVYLIPIQPGSIVFYDAVVLLGTPYVNQTEKEVRLVGYRVENVDYWIATDRHDLSAEQIALVRENKRLATMAKRSSYLSIYSRMNGRRR